MSATATKNKKTARKKISPIKKVRRFWDEVIQELKKSVWPTRPELMESTMVVIVSVVLVAAYVTVCDFIFRTAMRLLF
jgi:preprotein translocase subunit SecE